MLPVVFPRRAAGVFLPISALPSPGLIGDFGPAAYAFVDWLARAGQRYWQILPLAIVDAQGSPYASPSSMAGNCLYLNEQLLQDEDLLPPGRLVRPPVTSGVQYRAAAKIKWRMIRKSWQYFQTHATAKQRQQFVTFRRAEASWLTDFTLYQAIKDRQGHRPWWRWPAKWRRPVHARRHLDRRLRGRMDLQAYAQWLFEQQWQRLHAYARKQGIELIGDLPFYVQDDSVEAWTQPELFDLDRRGLPHEVAGVPPDDFSRTGQRWGNPVYHWAGHQQQGFSWWVERLRRLRRLVDVVRFDHFQGLAETFHIPVKSPDGRQGAWVKTPGHALIKTIIRRNKGLRLVAEDIGHPEPDAESLRRQYHFPGIRLLEFGWSGLPKNFHHPYFVPSDCLYFTSSHDSNTLAGWWPQSKWWERKHFHEWAGRSSDPIAWQAIRVAYRSRARVIMVPVQDILGLGKEARLNKPGRIRRNWVWRVPAGRLTVSRARRLQRLARQTRR